MKLSIYGASCLTLMALSGLNAQAPGDDLKQSITGGFIYGIPLNSFGQNNAPGYSVGYSYKLRRWLALEAGFDQVVHPIGSVEFLNNGIPTFDYANDQLYLIPFGTRFIWSPNASRWRLTVGGGGLYAYHQFAAYFSENFSHFGVQAVTSADYALSPSGRFRVGVTARVNYAKEPGIITRVFCIGPSFTYSFH